MNTTYKSSFTSNENTSLVWELLNENVKERFSYNIKNNSNPTINKFFVDTINQVSNNNQKYNSIIEMNKFTLLNCIKFIEKNIQHIKEPSKTDVFEIRMKKQKNEFDSLINKKIPKEIDFTDKFDNLPVDKSAVDKTLADRERELQQITKQYGNTDAESWIKNGIKNSDDDKIKIIEDSIDNSIQPILMDRPKIEKRVTFDIKDQISNVEIVQPPPPQPTNKFLNKLKKKDMYDTVVNEVAELKKQIVQMKEQFDSMEKNQSKILDLVSGVMKSINIDNMSQTTN